ncbi:MAG: YsnF/AvaK domain-containing protein [Microcoleus sp.]
MNNQPSVEKTQRAKGTTHFNRVPEKVRTKLKTFIVKDRDGELVGKIKDVYFDNSGKLNFLVAGKQGENPRLVLLNIKQLNTVDYQEKILFFKLSLEQIEMLPLKSANDSHEHLELPASPKVLSHSNPTPPVAIMSHETDADERPMDNLESPETHEDLDGEDLDIVDREIIRLLEERLVINRSKRKVGEVIVRKEIETRMVQVPIQREKLIVEQVGDDPKVLAEIDLGEGQITGIDLSEINHHQPSVPTVSAEFTSVQKASKVLHLIESQPRHGCVKVRIEIVLENQDLEETYQKLMDSYSDN